MNFKILLFLGVTGLIYSCTLFSNDAVISENQFKNIAIWNDKMPKIDWSGSGGSADKAIIKADFHCNDLTLDNLKINTSVKEDKELVPFESEKSVSCSKDKILNLRFSQSKKFINGNVSIRFEILQNGNVLKVLSVDAKVLDTF